LLKLPRLPQFIGIPIMATIVAAFALYYALTAYVVYEAKKNVQNLLLSHRGKFKIYSLMSIY
jgi:hypothetical protein